MTERDLVDTALGDIGVGPTVYEFFYTGEFNVRSTGKFEELLTGHDVTNGNIEDPTLYIVAPSGNITN
jgi:hypothetical protein